MGKIEESKAQFDQILLIDSNDACAWYGKVVSTLHENNIDDAMDILEKALHLDEGLKLAARQDSGFNTVRENKRFEALVK